jgi:hypothetical protein
MPILQPSVQSLYVEAVRYPIGGDAPVTLSTGTAFVAADGGRRFLVTNWHVTTGRIPGSELPAGSSAALPSHLVVWQNAASQLGTWVQVVYSLYDQAGAALWLVDPHDGGAFDIAALPLADDPSVDLYPYDVTDPAVLVTPTTDVSIVGFPFGLRTAGGIGVWSRGTVASEPDFDFDGKPTFLVDSRTRPGQSGSPVLFHSSQVPSADGGMAIYSAPQTYLLGIYSGRVSEQSDLGIVWRTNAIRRVVTGAHRDNLTFE